MKVFWNKCQGDAWCKLNSVNLEHAHFDHMEGVYIIWHGGNDAWTVRVGQGFIRDRLRDHRSNQEIQHYSNLILYVTWASVPFEQRNGVEKYLSDVLKPKIGERFPDITPININLPW
ncbi:MAG: hypothetical protein P4L45_14535 [Ignavibacteriaceae bacterium]|nr:hypothetical protein [Ignavibacteriaceae bacterium]